MLLSYGLKYNFILNIVMFIVIIGLIIWVVVLSNNSVPKQVSDLYKKWPKSMRPPSLNDKVVVYVSAPLFNLSETLYAIGVGGITPEVQESLVDTLCNLSTDDMKSITDLSNALGLPYYGIAGLCAQKGWDAYIPARDGFVLAKFINAVLIESSVGHLSPDDTTILLGYLTKAIYGNDVYALGAVCNVSIFNGDGLQVDDGSANEVGMVGVRGLPLAIFRDQLTDQFGPGASNPMPLGCASSIITQRYYKVQDAINNLDQKIKNIKSVKNNWWSGLDYTVNIPPPPLIQFWLEVGSAVYLTRYNTKQIYVDPHTGIQDTQKSSTDFFYQRYYKDGSSKALTEIAQQIMTNIQKIEEKWQNLIPIWAGCQNPVNITLDYIQKHPTACSVST